MIPSAEDLYGDAAVGGCGSVVELSYLDRRFVGSIPATTVTCLSVLEQDTEPQIAPTVVQWSVDGYECVSLNWWQSD